VHRHSAGFALLGELSKEFYQLKDDELANNFVRFSKNSFMRGMLHARPSGMAQ
jgi:hypothetical protein